MEGDERRIFTPLILQSKIFTGLGMPKMLLEKIKMSSTTAAAPTKEKFKPKPKPSASKKKNGFKNMAKPFYKPKEKVEKK